MPFLTIIVSQAYRIIFYLFNKNIKCNQSEEVGPDDKLFLSLQFTCLSVIEGSSEVILNSIFLTASRLGENIGKSGLATFLIDLSVIEYILYL